MAFEWPTVRLGNYVDSSLGKMLDANKNKGTPQPYLGNSNVRWGHFDLTDLAHMKFEPHESERYGIRDGDLIVCEGGEPGRCAIWREELSDMKIQKALHRVRAKDGLNNYYLFYWFMLAGRAGQLETHFTGTTIKHLTGKALAELQIPFPPLAEQHAIAETLGALDDRIDNLRQTNATLEAIAAAMFKSWFVDFDGVPPEDMQESELGLIPKGWRVIPLADAIDFKEGPGIRNWQYTNSDEGIKFINIRCIQDGDLHLDTANRITEEEANGKYSHFHLQLWDIVVSTSGTLGRSAIVRADHLPLVLNTSVIRFRPIEGRTAFSYLYQYLNGGGFLEKLESMASGSVQRNFGPMHLKQMEMLLPPFDVMQAYEQVCRPIYEQIVNNRSQAATLAALRDALLPRLISGRVRVVESEHVAGEIE